MLTQKQRDAEDRVRRKEVARAEASRGAEVLLAARARVKHEPVKKSYIGFAGEWTKAAEKHQREREIAGRTDDDDSLSDVLFRSRQRKLAAELEEKARQIEEDRHQKQLFRRKELAALRKAKMTLATAEPGTTEHIMAREKVRVAEQLGQQARAKKLPPVVAVKKKLLTPAESLRAAAAFEEGRKKSLRAAAPTEPLFPAAEGREKVTWLGKDLFPERTEEPVEVTWGEEYAARQKRKVPALRMRTSVLAVRKQRPVLSAKVRAMNESDYSKWRNESKASPEQKERYDREWKAGKRAIYGTNYRVIVEGVDSSGNRAGGPFVYDSSSARWTQKRKDVVLAELAKMMKEDYDIQLTGIKILGTYGKLGEMRVPV